MPAERPRPPLTMALAKHSSVLQHGKVRAVQLTALLPNIWRPKSLGRVIKIQLDLLLRG